MLCCGAVQIYIQYQQQTAERAAPTHIATQRSSYCCVYYTSMYTFNYYDYYIWYGIYGAYY